MHICSNLGETMVSVVHFLVTTVWKFCIAKPGLQGQAWALKISSQALDKGLSRAWAWLGLGFLGPGLAGLGLSGPARPSLQTIKKLLGIMMEEVSDPFMEDHKAHFEG